jgi:hypothetical protein
LNPSVMEIQARALNRQGYDFAVGPRAWALSGATQTWSDVVPNSRS